MTPHSPPNATTRHHRLGITYAVLSGVAFGFFGVFAKWSFEAGFTIGEQLALRFLVASAILWTYILIFLRREALLRFKELIHCAMFGVFGYAVFSFCYMRAVQNLTASMAVLLLYTYPALVALLGWRIFGEKPERRKVISLVPTMAGLTLLVYGDLGLQTAPHFVSGVTFGLLSALLYSLYIVLNRKIAHINPIIAVCYIQSATAITLSLTMVDDWHHTVQLMMTDGWLIVLTSVICTVGAMLLFLKALQLISATEVALLSTTEPITGVLTATIFLGENFVPLQTVGALCVIGALFYMSWPNKRSALHAT